MLRRDHRGAKWRKVAGIFDIDGNRVEPRVGVEPTTCRLRIGCSTTELPRLCGRRREAAHEDLIQLLYCSKGRYGWPAAAARDFAPVTEKQSWREGENQRATPLLGFRIGFKVWRAELQVSFI